MRTSGDQSYIIVKILIRIFYNKVLICRQKGGRQEGRYPELGYYRLLTNTEGRHLHVKIDISCRNNIGNK